MQFDLKKMVLPNDREFSYIEAGDPLGIPLILLHGLGDSCRAFEALFPHFPGRIRAIAYTQRGHDRGRAAADGLAGMVTSGRMASGER